MGFKTDLNLKRFPKFSNHISGSYSGNNNSKISFFLVVLGDVIAEALPAVAAKSDMFETIDITTLEAGGLTYVTESSPRMKEPAPWSGGKRPLRMIFCSCSVKHCNCRRKL